MNATLESIPARFARSVAQFATCPALVAPAGEWTYAELDRRSSAIAAHILSRTSAGSTPVALLFEHDGPLIAAILGVLKAGKMYLALDPNHPREQLTATLAAAGTTLLLADAAHAEAAKVLASASLKVLVVTDHLPSALSVSLPEISGDAGAWLMFTSGSTSAPKGVWQNHRGMVHEAETYAELAGITPEDRVSLLTHCGLSAAGGTLFGALLSGAALCPFSVRVHGVERLGDWLQRERITIFHSVPTVFRHLTRVAESKNPFGTVRLVRLGGEPVLWGDVELYRRFCPAESRFVQSLSSTETGIITTITFDPQSAPPRGRLPAGRPVPGVEVILLDDAQQPVPIGSEGRIAVRSTRLRQGYWGQPALTAEKFRPDGIDDARLFISNDLGKFLPNGTLEHLGRIDQLVKVRGHRVDLTGVEAALMATGLAQEAVAAALDDSSGEKRLAAYFVPRTGADVSAASFRRLLRDQLPPHMIPDDFVPLKQLPLTAAGKVDRRALPRPPRAETKAKLGPLERPIDLVEVRVTRVWQSVLNISPIARTDDFFELGGTSLQVVEVLLHLEKQWGVALPPSTLIEHSTIAALAVLLRDHIIIPSSRPLVTLREGGSDRPLFLIHSGQGDVTSYGLLTRRLTDRPVYGLQSKGLQGESWPLMSIGAMAECYIREIREKDPTGPYLLGATCMGGMVALEMAHRLRAAGQQVALLAMMDVPYPMLYSESSSRVERLYGPWRDFFRDGARILRWIAIRITGNGRSVRGLTSYRRFVSHMNTRAFRRYRPRIFPGEIVFLNTTAASTNRTRCLQFHQYARTAHTIDIPGDRTKLFVPPAVDELARQLQAALDRVEGRVPATV